MAAAKPRQAVSRLREVRYDGRDYDGEYGDGDSIGISGNCGKRKSGKTYLQWLSIELSKYRLIVFDSENQYRAPKYNVAGYAVFSQPGELRGYLAAHLQDERVRVIYKPLGGNKLWHFRTVTELVIRYGEFLHGRGKGLLYFVDEIDNYCPPSQPLEVYCPELNTIIEYGRLMRARYARGGVPILS